MISSVNLTNDQQQAINKLKKLRVGALFMEPGTGKTLTAIKLIQSTDTDLVVFLTPYQNKENITQEFEKWSIGKTNVVFGIETLSHSELQFEGIKQFINNAKRPFIVVDESLKIKNRDAIRSQRINELGSMCYYRLILNGTPISKNILDLWNQMEFLSPKILKMNYDDFLDNFVKYVKTEFINKDTDKITVKGYENLNYLYSLIDPFVYDCKLSITSKKQYQELDYQLSDCLQRYEAVNEHYKDMIWGLDDSNIFLAMCQEMQQSYSLDKNKIKAIEPFVDDKTIIFCKFVKTKQYLQGKFKQTLILTFGKGSLGLNLQQYNRIIFFDKTFNFAQREQAEHRIYRTGQKSDCHFIDLTANIGLDKFINHNIGVKSTLGNTFKSLIKQGKTKDLFKQ